MSNPTTSTVRQDAFIADMVERMTTLARHLTAWATAAPHSLQDLEQMTLQRVKELGMALVAGLCQLRAPTAPLPTVPCPCGGTATYQRQREVAVQTLLGPISFTRPYYLCATCHHGGAPLDQELGVAAGSLSAGLTELIALLGALDPFADAVGVLEKLTLVQVCANTVRDATETLGQTIAANEAQAIAAAWDVSVQHLPPPPPAAPARLYVSMDGTMVHADAEGWRELKLGACYTTRTVVPRKRPDRLEVRAEHLSFVADISDPHHFGQLLWLEACRRGVRQAKEVVAIGDGAHWIWNLVEEHFPEAIQIVDWYHATEYLHAAAQAIYGMESDLAKQWAAAREDELWAGQVPTVLACLQAHAGGGKEAVADAITYYTNNAARMRYPDYRARGIQIGSGSIESGCNHVVGARLNQAGMIWNVEGARAVAKVRARLKSGRWEETIAQRPPPRRTYQRQRAA
jgi:hypothetical protein